MQQYTGTPYRQPSFKFYKGTDVKKGKGGYARVTLPNGQQAWGTASENPFMDSGIAISFMGWGESPVIDLTDFSETDQSALRQTI